MGFKSVYGTLQEIFPEIDARLLRAVAIENSKDPDAAVNDVLNEVIPHMAVQSIDRNSSAHGRKILPAIHIKEPKGIPYESSENMLPRKPIVDAAFVEPSSRSGFAIGESSKDFSFKISHNNTGLCSEPVWDDVGKDLAIDSIRKVSISDHQDLDKVDKIGSSLEPNCADMGNHVTIDSSTMDDEPSVVAEHLSHSEECNDHLLTENLDEELIVLKGRYEHKTDVECIQTVNDMSNGLEKEVTNEQVYVNADASKDLCDKHGLVISEVTNGEVGFTGILDEPDRDSYEVDCNVTGGFVASEEGEPSNAVTEMASPVSVEIADSTVGHRTIESVASDEQSFNGSLLEPENVISEAIPPVLTETADAKECELQSEAGAFNLSASNDYSFIEVGGNDNDFARKSKQSGQICCTEFLDEIIEDAKNNKKNLFSVMDSVMKLIEEVQLEERAAEVAKEEAARGGVDILVKVEEMKQMLAHAKEANDMHAGEVYGEKSILAAEARELQSRLLCLSEERDKSLSTLDEMRQTLEARLGAAEEVKRAAELEKREKEESARKALTEQEAIMEKVVQESKVLEREAEENSKLQEFLVDRGRVLDVLQGEISVICEDVRLLKENFDKRIPLSMSVSSSQTTCKLASSASSQKSISSDKAPEEPEGTSSASSVENISAEKDFAKHDGKAIEDEWEIFDKEEEVQLRI